jgi:iron complex outermembrane receptor protein
MRASWLRLAPLPLAVLCVGPLSAGEISGSVRDNLGRAVAGAHVSAGPAAAETDASGAYRLAAAAGDLTLHVSCTGYETATREVSVSADRVRLDIMLQPRYRASEEVVVQAIRADARAPVTRTDLKRDEIAGSNRGDEMPFLLRQAPSITLYSDSGIGAGYSYFYLRGIQQTRINMTLDGVPLNEPEDSALYFSNFADFASSLDSIQIQRGVGTSTVGTASYGGSINFASVGLADAGEVTGELAAGSFGSSRASLAGQTGRLGSGLALYGRATYKNTDGFRDHSGVEQHGVYFGASRQGQKSFFKLFGFSGREKTELAFLAVERDALERDLRTNPLSPEEKDRFGQDFLQAQWTRFLGVASSLAVQGYYNGAQGWYRLWDDEAARQNLLQYALEWRLAGAALTLHRATDRVNFSYGAHVNSFWSHHHQDVVGGVETYSNRNTKTEINSFAKLGYELGRSHLFADAQLRHARFRYKGLLPLGEVGWTFLNPKLGVRRDLTPRFSLYASAGRATREPARQDMLSGEDDASSFHDLRAVTPERVADFEIGAAYQRPGLSVDANAYAMEFRNEIALTGELSEIGLPLRRNVASSHRRGVEWELTWKPHPAWRVTSVGNLSANRIREWTQFYDVYDEAGSTLGRESRRHRDVNPLLTPALNSSLGVDWTPSTSVGLGLQARYVAKAHLDNTNDDAFTTPAFLNLDASASLALKRWIKLGEPRLRLQLNNLLDNRRIWPSGYSYLFLTRDEQGRDTPGGIPYYYPQATRGVFVSLDFKL